MTLAKRKTFDRLELDTGRIIRRLVLSKGSYKQNPRILQIVDETAGDQRVPKINRAHFASSWANEARSWRSCGRQRSSDAAATSGSSGLILNARANEIKPFAGLIYQLSLLVPIEQKAIDNLREFLVDGINRQQI